MKEALFYTIDCAEWKQLEEQGCVTAIEEVALVYGMSYRGFRTMHLPLDVRYGRRFCFASRRSAMQQCGLWDALQYENIKRTKDSAGKGDVFEGIKCVLMRPPAPEKFAYYENYFRNTGRILHPVFVDAEKNIVSGYIAYLLAKQYNHTIEVCQVFSSLPVQKIICGKMVVQQGQNYVPVEEESELEIYGLDATVSEGEVLWLRMENRICFLQIDRIEYATGKVLQCDAKE